MNSIDPPVTPSPKQPLVNIPPVTLVLMLAMTVVHLARTFVLSAADDQNFVLMLGFIPDRLRVTGFHAALPWINLVSYSLLHFGWTHFCLNITALAAFGSAIEKTFGKRRYLGILVFGIVAGALTHFALYSGSLILLGGISAGISALFAIVLGLMQQGRVPHRGWRGLLKPITAWVMLNIVIGLMGMPGQPGLAVGWVAHLGGFAAGLLCLSCVMPAYRIFNTRKPQEIADDELEK